MIAALERHLGRFALPRLTLVLVALQVGGYVLTLNDPEVVKRLALLPAAVAAGEVWRLLTYAMVPISQSPISMLFTVYILVVFGRGVEQRLGDFRYNLFILGCWFMPAILIVIASMLGAPMGPVTIGYLLAAIVAGAAATDPDHEILLFFLIPLKMRILNLIILAALGFYLISALFSMQWANAVAILIVLANYMVFFGPYHRADANRRIRAVVREHRETKAKEQTVLHRCAVCDRTEKSDPDLDFRVCSQCSGGQEYCMDHLGSHEHQ